VPPARIRETARGSWLLLVGEDDQQAAQKGAFCQPGPLSGGQNGCVSWRAARSWSGLRVRDHRTGVARRRSLRSSAAFLSVVGAVSLCLLGCESKAAEAPAI